MLNDEKLVFHEGGEFVAKVPPWMNARIKMAPDTLWDGKSKTWHMPATKANAKFILNEFNDAELAEGAKSAAHDIANASQGGELFPAWFPFKNPPMKHQKTALNEMWPLEAGGLFMEMRTGKTFVVVNLAAARAMMGDINALMVVCPTSIKPVWKLQFQEHSPIPFNMHMLEAGGRKAAERFIVDTTAEGIKVLVVGVKALSQGGAFDLATRFMQSHKAMMAIDESSRIKKFQAARTKRCISLGGYATHRYIMTGTPVTQGIEDLYAQFRFLDWKIIGLKSEFAFKNRYCIMGGFKGRQIVGYSRVGELFDLIRPHVYQVHAKDVIDLPPKIYEQRYVKPTKEQKKALDELGDPFNMATEQNDNVLEIGTVLERMTRHQQITGGLFPYKDGEGNYQVEPINGKNPKIEELKDVMSDLPEGTKVIIWARFRPEIAFICEALGQMGIKYVEYHGGITDKETPMVQFQEDPSITAFVGNQQSAGMGLELSAASVHIYYSNSFSYEDRKQSEARTNSGNQKAESILYIDILMDADIDRNIEKAMLKKESMASYVKRKLEG